MMGIIDRMRSGALYGKAVAKFLRRDFAGAAILFEESRRLLPEDERIEFTLSYIGRCYAALGRTAEALQVLEEAYEPFCRRSQTLQEPNEQREFLDFLKAFSGVLKESGQRERSRDVESEMERQAHRFRMAKHGTAD